MSAITIRSYHLCRLSQLGPIIYENIPHIHFKIISLSNLSILSIPDEGYSSNVPDEGYSSNVPDEGYSSNVPNEGHSRNASCALNVISTCLLYLTLMSYQISTGVSRPDYDFWSISCLNI